MVKMREQWPCSHNSERVDAVKEVRTSIVVAEGSNSYDLAACAEVRRRAEAMAAVSSDGVCIIEGKAVAELQRYWQAWIAWAS